MDNPLELLKKNYPNSKHYIEFSNPLELMVATILSSQVRDTVVNDCTKELFKKYRTAKDYAEADVKELETIIKPITFYQNKVKNIKASCKILEEKYNGKVPSMMDELIELPGIGRKSANAILQNGFNIIEGVTVDTHVIRVSYRLGWTSNKQPEKIEQDLMKLFPKSEWKTIPFYLKSHGRAFCKAPIPICSQCFLSKICPKNGVIKKA
ncbi:MAG: endonuclease III [Candidatus Aenigmarchaeota archaeon]|nr:endonuclease III [Candidatus Aenigmarchaeota archaeon]